MKYLEFKVNDKFFRIPEHSHQINNNLQHFLREEGFTGCKQVCGEGGCGVCTVIVSRWDAGLKKVTHASMTACLVPLINMHNVQITSIEGLSLLTDKTLHPVCDAFYQLGASQCGFCTPGFILAFVARLANDPPPNKADLELIFDGNLCRCTGYRSIMDAASVFCSDPLENGEYIIDVKGWKENFKKCRKLESLFPEEYKKQLESIQLNGEHTTWFQPTELEDVYSGVKNARIIAGNTDVGYQERKKPEQHKNRIYLSQVEKLKQITWHNNGLEIGASVTIAQLKNELDSRNNIPCSLQAIKDQCKHFANNQVRNMATVGGGLVNFSTYSDLVPVWVATKSQAIFINDGEEKSYSLFELYDDNGNIKFEPSELGILVSLFVPLSSENEIIYSYKYARRRMDSITFLSSCMHARVNNKNEIVEAIFCFDGLGVPGFRALKTEKTLIGKIWDAELQSEVFETLAVEVNRANTSPLPEPLKKYQCRLSKGILVRFFKQYRHHFFDEHAIEDTMLLSRYPHIAHRSHIKYDESSVGVLGKAIPHKNSRNQTNGKAKYTADVDVPNCYFGALVKSPVAHGKVLSIDPTRALKHPDVIGFYSAQDIPGKNIFGFREEDEEILATETVGYVGQALGILVAKTDALAKEYANYVDIKIEEKTPILNFQQAIDAGSFHGRPDGYLLYQGDNQKGFTDSDIVVEGTVKLPGQNHFYLEPNSALVIPKDNGYHVFSSTQSPSNVVDRVSEVLGIPNNKVNVQIGRLGGGFGGKQLRAGPIAAICSLAAAKLNNPVKLTLEKHEDMAYCPGRSPTFASYKLGMSKEGMIKALDVEFYINGGFTNDYSADIAETATLLLDSCYHLPNIKVRGTALKMNFGSNTACRGFGKPLGSAIIEAVIDHGSSQLELDPTLVREKNLYQKGHKTITKVEIKDDVMSNCWNRLMEKSNYGKLKNEIDEFNKNNKWVKRGIAAVSSKGNMGFIESDDINRGLCLIHILRDGTVVLNHSGCEMGQGINTRMGQVVAHNLEVPFKNVEVTDTQSALIPNTPPTTMVASDLVGKAIINACKELNAILDKYSGTFIEKVELAYSDGKNLSANGIYTAPRLSYDYEKQEGNISYFFVWASGLTVAEIDLISGSFRLLKSKVVQDCGKSLNPHLDVGQAEGGFLFGVGYYTMEEMIYSDKGKLISDNVSGYKVPSCGDIPLDWDIELTNYAPIDECLHNSKGIGEANTQLGLSAYFAIKEAMKAARIERGMSPVFSMDFPASVDRVSALLPDVEGINAGQ